jgi:hypothetical protein
MTRKLIMISTLGSPVFVGASEKWERTADELDSRLAY